MSALARALIDRGRLPANDVNRCLSRSAQKNTSLPDELVQAGLMDSGDIADFIAQTFGFTRLDPFQLESTALLADLSAALYQDPRYLPVGRNGRRLSVTERDGRAPEDANACDHWLRSEIRRPH